MPDTQQSVSLDLDIVGSSGLKMRSGILQEEWLPHLRGRNGMRIYREMGDNDPTVGAVLFAIESLIREVPWFVKPAEESDQAQEVADFVDSCREDMSHTWDDFIVEALSMLQFGWALHEIVYKRRLGLEPGKGLPTSRFDDGRIGWRKIPLRAQDSLDRWEPSEDGFVTGMHQRTDGHTAFIPLEKAILFRTRSRLNNPEGRSILRNAYRPWYHLKRDEDLEGIGIERDTVGVPDFQVPWQWLSPNATDDQKQLVNALKKMGQEMRNDERACMIRPSEMDSDGNPTGFKFGLISASGSKLYDTDKVITRKKHEIATTVIMDWIHLGQDKVGSFALASNKTNMSSRALRAVLKALKEPINRFMVPRLMRLNNIPQDLWPTIAHGDIEAPPLEEIGKFIGDLVQAGGLQLGDSDERWVREIARMPEKDEPDIDGEDVGAPVHGGEEVDPQSALNGAQVTALLEVVDRVARGFLPRQSGVNAIAASFPLTREQADEIMGEVGRSFAIEPGDTP